MNSFMKVYGPMLEQSVRLHPEEYGYPLESVPTVLARMRIALTTRTYNKDSRAFRETCKVLNIKHTYAAINRYIDNHE